MSSKLIETVDLETDIDIEFGPREMVDDRLLQVYETLFGVSYLLEGITHEGGENTRREALEMRIALEMRVSEGDVEDDISEYLGELLAAHKSGMKVVGRDDTTDLALDFSRIDEPTLAELHENVQPVAQHLGTELDLPECGGTGDEVTVTGAESSTNNELDNG